MKVTSKLWFLTAFIIVALITTGCHPSPRDLTVLTGKTVYGNLALENVTLQVHRWEEAGWRYLSDSQSGYHGSFRLHLPPGTYRITASKNLRTGQEQIVVTGVLDALEIKSSAGRIDQVLLLMRPTEDGSS